MTEETRREDVYMKVNRLNVKIAVISAIIVLVIVLCFLLFFHREVTLAGSIVQVNGNHCYVLNVDKEHSQRSALRSVGEAFFLITDTTTITDSTGNIVTPELFEQNVFSGNIRNINVIYHPSYSAHEGTILSPIKALSINVLSVLRGNC